MNPLASRCPCGHAAFHHASPEQQAVRLAESGGRWAAECKGGERVHCRCVTDRAQVIAAHLAEIEVLR